jgi:hypothetical protein
LKARLNAAWERAASSIGGFVLLLAGTIIMIGVRPGPAVVALA